MTHSVSASTTRRMPLRQKWQQTSLANKVIVILSTAALVVSLVGMGFTVFFSTQQSDINSTVATFQAQVQTTALYQSNQQVFMQQTQTVLDQQIQSLAIQQAYPLVVVIPNASTIKMAKLSYKKEDSGFSIDGIGITELIIANNGGGKASFYDITWDTSQTKTGNLTLSVVDTAIENSTSKLPLALEGQTPIKVQITLEAKLFTQENLTGKSEIQLARIWTDALGASNTNISLKFANMDTLSVPVSNIILSASELPTDDEVNAIAHKIYCPVCENTSLDRCLTDACKEWRELIRTMLAEGKTEDEVVKFLVDQYGARELPQDPWSNLQLNLVAELIGVLLIFALMQFRLRKKQTTSRTTPESTMEPKNQEIETDEEQE